MTFEARQEFVDSHFMGLCLFALWADGSLSINERQFLADVVWFMSEKDEALSYDFDFFVRSKLVNTIKVIEETYPSLNTEKRSPDVSSVIDALKEIVIRLDSLLDVILVEVDEKHVEDARKGIFRDIVQSYVGLALCDGNLDERERKILRGVERQVPSSVFDVSGFVSDSGLYDLSLTFFSMKIKLYREWNG